VGEFPESQVKDRMQAAAQKRNRGPERKQGYNYTTKASFSQGWDRPEGLAPGKKNKGWPKGSTKERKIVGLMN